MLSDPPQQTTEDQRMERLHGVPIQASRHAPRIEDRGLTDQRARSGVERLDAGPKGATVTFHKNSFANPAGLIAFIQKQVGEVKLRPDHTLVYRRAWDSEAARVKGVRTMLDELVKLAA